MGIQWFNTSTKMMKSIVFAALVAAVYADAEPKADADAYLGYTGLTQGVRGVHGVPGVQGIAGLGYAAPYGYAASPYAYGVQGLAGLGYAAPYGYAASPYGYGYHSIGKRSADAEPAYPGYLGYTAGLAGYGYASPYYGANLAGYRAYPYASYGAFPHHALGKRSADADADAAYLGAYNGYASPFNYGYGYNSRAYGYPYRALNSYGHRAYGYGW